jgi:hypothetical protein
MRGSRLPKHIVLLAVLISSSAFAQRAALTVSSPLDRLAREAQLIVRGRVTSTRVEPHPHLTNLTTLVVTLSVEETLKGPARRTMEFRQYIWDISDQRNAAGYTKGEELLLMLGPVSQYGLTSPVGLEQGRFRVVREKGQATAVNGRGNLGLFQSVEQRARTQGIALSAKTASLLRRKEPGPVPLTELQDAIRTFARAK